MNNWRNNFLYVVIFCACLTACDEVDLKGVDAGNVQGLWQISPNEGNNTFLLVSDTVFNFYTYNATAHCLTEDAYHVIKIEDSGFYTVKKNLDDDENTVFALSINHGRVHVRNINGTQRQINKYWPSELDIDQFAPTCFNANVLSTWKLNSSEPVEFMQITETEIARATFDTTSACFNSLKFEVLDRLHSTFTLQERTGNLVQISATFEIEDTLLTATWHYAEQTVTEQFFPTDSLFSKLEPFCYVEGL